MNRQVEEWGDIVTVISCDMREWKPKEKVCEIIILSVESVEL